jgi:hypothetical protein
VPHFRQSRSRHAVLPGGQHYVHVSLPQVPPGCRELVTKREDDEGGEYFWCVLSAQRFACRLCAAQPCPPPRCPSYAC